MSCHTTWSLPALVLVFALCSACTLSQVQLRTLEANNAFTQGSYQDAMVRYLDSAGLDPSIRQILSYNLANVYHSLGEVDAAFSFWNQALASSDAELLFNTEFNKGLALYEQGKYIDAEQSFRRALQLDPSNMDAKINLELCYKKNDGQSRNLRQSPAAQKPAQAVNLATERLLEYVKRKEAVRTVGGDQSAGERMDDR